MTSRTWLRIGLLILAATQAIPAVWAAIWPWSFFFEFPVPTHPWVAAFPPYNDHLVRDAGMVALQFVAIVVFALVALHPYLVRVALVSSFLFNVLHLMFHLSHLGRFAPGDVAAQLATLIFPVVLAAILLWLNRRACRRRPSTDSGAFG